MALRSLPGMAAPPELTPEFPPDGGRREAVSLVADNALAAFILTQVALKRSAGLARYEWMV